MITYDEFIEKYLGKKVDYDGYAGVQCVDFAKIYLQECFGIKCGAMGNAKDWWYDRNINPILRDNFDSITVNNKRPVSSTSIQKGDIGIRTSGTWGHIFVCDHVKGSSITYYDQNGTGNHDAVTKRTKPFTSYYVTGVLRKKTIKMTVQANGGLHYYKHIKSEPSGTIPDKTEVKVIVKDAGTKTVNKTKYKMCIIWYKGNQYYVAQKYLK